MRGCGWRVGPGPWARDDASAGGCVLPVAARRGDGREAVVGAVVGAPVLTAAWFEGRILRAGSEVEGGVAPGPWPGPGAGGGGIC